MFLAEIFQTCAVGCVCFLFFFCSSCQNSTTGQLFRNTVLLERRLQLSSFSELLKTLSFFTSKTHFFSLKKSFFPAFDVVVERTTFQNNNSELCKTSKWHNREQNPKTLFRIQTATLLHKKVRNFLQSLTLAKVFSSRKTSLRKFLNYCCCLCSSTSWRNSTKRQLFSNTFLLRRSLKLSSFSEILKTHKSFLPIFGTVVEDPTFHFSNLEEVFVFEKSIVFFVERAVTFQTYWILEKTQKFFQKVIFFSKNTVFFLLRVTSKLHL